MKLKYPLLAVLLVLSSNMLAHAQADDIRFDREIRPILSENCFHCHGPDEETREGELRLDLEEEAKISAIVSGKPEESEFFARITSEDPDLKMPPEDSNKSLDAEQIELLKQWISQGAKWKKHWSFEAPQKAPVPNVKNQDWPVNPIDHFVLHNLEQNNLKPSPEADRRTLVRRLSFDLTGLPPTLEQVNEFVNDSSENAYEKLVDRLLASPHYGERMAVNWMDNARYGDTSVYHADGYRDMWAWRDQIVKSYNDNLPFDQFSIFQLAGDLVPDATLDQKILAGFNRNNGTTDEGGLIPEEYRVEYTVDRVKTTATVWMGLTMECGQCHEHKYDPISQEDYYSFFAFFNISADAGKQTRERNSAPLVKILDPANMEQLPGVKTELTSLSEKMEIYSKSIDDKLKGWVSSEEKKIAEQIDIPEDAVLHLPLNEAKDKTVVNKIDPEQKGEIKGPANWVKARYEDGLKLDGETHLFMGDIAGFERTDSFSYGSWVWNAPGATGAILSRMNDGNNFRGYDILINAKGQIEVHLVNKWPDNAIKVTTQETLKSFQWNHIFAVYDGTSKAAGLMIYINGEPTTLTTEKDSLSETIKTSHSLRIGSRNPSSKLSGKIDEIRIYPRKLTDLEVRAIALKHPLESLLAISQEERTDEQFEEIRRYYLENEDSAYQDLKKQHSALKTREEKLLKPVTTVMVMGDQEKPRDTFVLARGAYDAPTKVKVQPRTPLAFPPMKEGAPANRLGMAQWLFQDDHPLTARVAVNRYWQMLFGKGFVLTPEDFGSQGEFPSHPELMDWLAVDFRESGWDVKRFLKQIVMSATYRQSSEVSQELYERDPGNRLLARGARYRLQGEFIRDNALSLSGLLVDKKGGPGVKPYQPPGLWKEVGLGGKPSFVQDHGESLYRRSLYTYWKRSAPPPNMQIFDAPTREKCSVRRARTNTPLQALVVMNDVQFTEASRNFAERILKEGGKTEQEKVIYAFSLATARDPDDQELKEVLDLLETALEHYKKDSSAALKLIGLGESPRDEQIQPEQLAAWTVVANMIFNLDEVLTRE